MKNVFLFYLSSLSPVHHSHINSFCQSHKRFSCPPDGLPCHRSFSKRGIAREWQMRRRRKRQHERGFLLTFPNTQGEKICYSAVYLVSLPYRSTDNNEQVQAPIVGRWQEMKMSEGAVWEIRAFLRSVSLSFFRSVCTAPSLSFLSAYDYVTRLLNRYMHPSFTHQAVCNRTIPQFIFHIIVSPFLACHGGLALWVLWRRGWDRRADRRKVEGCWASLRGCLAL